MKFVVRPELPTAALRSSQATLAAVDNSAPLATRRSPLKTRGNVVQTTGATSARSSASFLISESICSTVRVSAAIVISLKIPF